MNWMFLPLKRYVEFSGRSRRMEFWMFVLFGIIVNIVARILDSMLGMGGHTGSLGGDGAFTYTTSGTLESIASLALLIPNFSVAFRRLHDTDRSAWWLLISLTGIGILVLLIFFCLDGTRGPNRFGPDPKEEPAP